MYQEDFDMAEENFDKAESIYYSLKIDASGLLNLQKGILYKNKGKLDLATKLFNEIISKNEVKDVFKTRAEALYQLGVIETSLNHNNLAANYLNRALQANAKDGNLDQKVKILLELSTTYDKLLDVKRSYSYLKAHLLLKDSLSHLNDVKLDITDYEAFKESERMRALEQLKKITMPNKNK